MPAVRLVSLAILLLGTTPAVADDYQLAKVTALPEGVPTELQQVLSPQGQQVTGSSGPVCEFWFAKSFEVREGFTPTLSVKYPLVPGSFVGLLRVVRPEEFTDFRGQELLEGIYTLRYGQQPEDGNHIGTSELADFLLAIPMEQDTSTKIIDSADDVNSKSAEAAGTTHPAIFSLLPIEQAADAPSLAHDEKQEFWILQIGTDGTRKTGLRMVVIGFTEA
jgi:hypothetical protein